MEDEKAKKGDIRPVYQVSSYQVCRKEAKTPEEEEWTPVENFALAEMLSFVYKQEK